MKLENWWLVVGMDGQLKSSPHPSPEATKHESGYSENDFATGLVRCVPCTIEYNEGEKPTTSPETSDIRVARELLAESEGEKA